MLNTKMLITPADIQNEKILKKKRLLKQGIINKERKKKIFTKRLITPAEMKNKGR